MGAGPWVVYQEFNQTLGLKAVNLNADSMMVALFLSTSNCGNAALVNARYATLTGQVAAANGYTTGGVACTPSYTQTSGVATFDTADASYTATGGNITARFAVVYDNVSTNKDLIAYCLLDSTPADVVIPNGNTLTIRIANIFSLVPSALDFSGLLNAGALTMVGSTPSQVVESAVKDDGTTVTMTGRALTVTGVVNAAPGGFVPSCAVYTINYNNAILAAAATTTAEVVLFQLPARAKILGISIRSATAFLAAGATVINVSLGAAAGTVVGPLYTAATAYSPTYDLLPASSNTNYYEDGGFASATDAAHNIVARFTTAGANLNTMTAGQVNLSIVWMSRPTGVVIP